MSDLSPDDRRRLEDELLQMKVRELRRMGRQREVEAQERAQKLTQEIATRYGLGGILGRR